jgi:hypothetical protein
VRSLPTAPPVPINLTTQVNDRSITLSWEITDSSNITRFRIYRALGTDGAFDLIDSSAQFSQTLTHLPFNQSARLRVTTVNGEMIEGQPSAEATVRAGLLSLVIENNDMYTNSRNVQVRLTVPGTASYVQLSEDSLFQSGSTARPFQTTMSFELSQGDGDKRVFARFDFADGSESGDPVFDEIILDTRAVIDSVSFIPVGQTFARGDTILFSVYTGETGGEASASFPGVSNIALFDDGTDGDSTAADGIYAAYYVVPVGVTVDNGRVQGRFTDAAGNAAVTAEAAATLDIHPNTLPVPVTLAISLQDTLTAHLSWTINDDNDFASYRIYRSVSAGILVENDFLTISIITDQNTVTLNDYLPGGGTYYYRVFVFDLEGNTAGSNEVVISR